MPSTDRSPAADRRQKRRHPVEDLRGSLLFSYRCRVLDLSADGMAVRTNTPLAPGRTYSLKVEHGDRGVTLSGTIAWCRLQGTEPDASGESVPVYRAGVELERRVEERLAEIRSLLEQRGIVQLERRIAGRIVQPGAPHPDTPDTPGPADRADRADRIDPTFIVRRLSRTGMVLDASTVPTVGDPLHLTAALDDGPLDLPVRVTAVRELAAGNATTDARPPVAAEVSVTFGDLPPTQRDRLDTLIREELGLG